MKSHNGITTKCESIATLDSLAFHNQTVWTLNTCQTAIDLAKFIGFWTPEENWMRAIFSCSVFLPLFSAFHLYSNSSERETDEILSVKYEDGRWSKPYYDCGGANIWMLTYTVPFFGYENGTYFFK